MTTALSLVPEPGDRPGADVAPALDRDAAAALTRRLRGVIADLAELIDQAKRGQVWLPLGYPTWEAYRDAELADRLPRLSVEQRRAAVADLHARGHSKRSIGRDFYIADQTVRADLAAVAQAAAPPVVAVAVAPTPTVDRVVDALAAAGVRGLTWAEAGRKLRLHHGQVSGALSSLHRRGRVTRTTTYRDACAVYVHPDHAPGA